MAQKKEKAARIDLTELDPTAIVAKLNAKYGANTLVLASHMIGQKQGYISTTIAALDLALGGGFAKNKITEIRGPYSAMKSTVTMLAMASHQRENEHNIAALIDVEKSFEIDYFVALGGDPDRLIVVNPDSGEQAVDVISDILGLSVSFLLVIDSIAGLVPTAEIEGSMDQQFMGLHPRLINRLMRVVTARMKRNLYTTNAPSTTVIAINQLREKIGVMFGDPETTPGGKGKDFFCSTRIRLSAPRSKRVMKDIERNGIKKQIQMAQEVSFTIDKNRCGVDQYCEGAFMWFKRPFEHYAQYEANNDETILSHGLFYDVIVPTKTGLSLGKTGKIIPKKKSMAVKKLHMLPKIRAALQREIIAKMRKDAKDGIKSK